LLRSRVKDFYDQLSLEKVPAFIINIGAVLVVVVGAFLFGDRPFWEVATDTVFALVVLGGAVAIVLALAVNVGGFYQKGVRKYVGFGFLGVSHAILQLLTPIVLVYFGDWRLLIAVVLVTVLTNGLGPTWAVLDMLAGRTGTDGGSKGFVQTILSARFAAWVMKRGSAFLMLAVWLIYGATVLASPFVLRWFMEPQTSKTLIDSLVMNHFGPVLDLWIRGALLLVVAFYIGYRMSRLWFSWYLGVSLLFNGHNNEAGGGARIEGFKHILRVKVEESKLTVYVIGLEKAETDMENMSPKLVDKFELECKPIEPVARF
jgi:hypothetical protein